MKAAVVAKFIQTLAAILLVVPFLVGAIFVGHWAVTVAERASHNLLFAALALCGIALSIVQGSAVRHSAFVARPSTQQSLSQSRERWHAAR